MRSVYPDSMVTLMELPGKASSSRPSHAAAPKNLVDEPDGDAFDFGEDTSPAYAHLPSFLLIWALIVGEATTRRIGSA